MDNSQSVVGFSCPSVVGSVALQLSVQLPFSCRNLVDQQRTLTEDSDIDIDSNVTVTNRARERDAREDSEQLALLEHDSSTSTALDASPTSSPADHLAAGVVLLRAPPLPSRAIPGNPPRTKRKKPTCRKIVTNRA